MDIPITRYIEQVEDGTAYKGHILINGWRFDYQLSLSVHIDQLRNVKTPTDLGAARDLFRISLTKDRREVELDDEKWTFFFRVIAYFAVMFYWREETRTMNNGGIEELLQKNPSATGVRLSMTGEGVRDVPSELLEKLSPVFERPSSVA